MDAGRQRAMVRKSTTTRLKQQGEALASASKAMLPFKVAPKSKGLGKDDRPTKKVIGQFDGAVQEEQP